MTRNERIINKIATRCNRICIASLSVAVLSIAWMALEVFCEEPVSTFPEIIAWAGMAAGAVSMSIGKTIEDVK